MFADYVYVCDVVEIESEEEPTTTTSTVPYEFELHTPEATATEAPAPKAPTKPTKRPQRQDESDKDYKKYVEEEFTEQKENYKKEVIEYEAAMAATTTVSPPIVTVRPMPQKPTKRPKKRTKVKNSTKSTSTTFAKEKEVYKQELIDWEAEQATVATAAVAATTTQPSLAVPEVVVPGVAVPDVAVPAVAIRPEPIKPTKRPQGKNESNKDYKEYLTVDFAKEKEAYKQDLIDWEAEQALAQSTVSVGAVTQQVAKPTVPSVMVKPTLRPMPVKPPKRPQGTTESNKAYKEYIAKKYEPVKKAYKIDLAIGKQKRPSTSSY